MFHHFSRKRTGYQSATRSSFNLPQPCGNFFHLHVSASSHECQFASFLSGWYIEEKRKPSSPDRLLSKPVRRLCSTPTKYGTGHPAGFFFLLPLSPFSACKQLTVSHPARPKPCAHLPHKAALHVNSTPPNPPRLLGHISGPLRA